MDDETEVEIKLGIKVDVGTELELDKLVCRDGDDEELVAAAPKPDEREVALLLDSVDKGLVVGTPELDEEALDTLA